VFDFTRRDLAQGVFCGLVAALVVASLGLAGCSSSYPNAVAFNHDLAEEADNGVPGRSDQQLSGRQKSASLKAMKSVAAGHTVVNPPAPAPRGVRWSEIPRAVKWACGQAGVEMTITDTFADPDEYQFELLTIESCPAELVIVQGTGDRVYEVESVWVGRFPDQPQHVERAALLVSHFEAQLRVLGARKQVN
jgi:hypothetical protein